MLIQTPWMARMVPHQQRLEVLMAGVVRWGSDVGSWSAPRMARSFHEALGVSFASANPQKYVDALLYGLTLARGAKVTSFDLPPDAAAVSFAICDQVTNEVHKVPQKRQTTTLAKSRATPKKGGASGGTIPMQVDYGNIGAGGGDTGGGTKAPESTGEVAHEEDEEMTHKRPSYRNARWLRKRPGAARWTQKMCRLLEGWIGSDEDGLEHHLGSMIEELWQVLLGCDKSRKDALKSRIKEHEKKRKAKERKQRKKEKKRHKKSMKSKRHQKWSSRGSSSGSSFSDNGSSGSGSSPSSMDDSSSSSGRSSKSRKSAAPQRPSNQPEFKWIDGKRHFKSRKTGDWVNCEGPPQKRLPGLWRPPLVV